MPNIEDKIIYHHSSGNIEIPILLNEKGVLIRDESPLQQGKRYRCALIHNIKGEDGKAQQLILTGEYPTKDGRSVNTGCNCQTLCLKAGGISSCCDINMTLETPPALPSSD